MQLLLWIKMLSSAELFFFFFFLLEHPKIRYVKPYSVSVTYVVIMDNAANQLQLQLLVSSCYKESAQLTGY